MNDADRKAFEAWKIEQFQKGEPRLVPSESWQAACEWRDSQVGGPVGEVIDNENACLFGTQKLAYGTLLYTAPPAAQINQQIVEALELADAALEGAHMNPDVIYKKVKAALAAARETK